MTDAAITHLVGACAGVFGLAAFAAFILVPAVRSYARTWERLAAAFLSLYVLAALVGVGIVAGGGVIYLWSRYF